MWRFFVCIFAKLSIASFFQYLLFAAGSKVDRNLGFRYSQYLRRFTLISVGDRPGNKGNQPPALNAWKMRKSISIGPKLHAVEFVAISCPSFHLSDPTLLRHRFGIVASPTFLSSFFFSFLGDFFLLWGNIYLVIWSVCYFVVKLINPPKRFSGWNWF